MHITYNVYVVSASVASVAEQKEEEEDMDENEDMNEDENENQGEDSSLNMWKKVILSNRGL